MDLQKDDGIKEGLSYIKLTSSLRLVSICDMVDFLKNVDHEKFKVIFNKEDVRVMIQNTLTRGQFTIESGNRLKA